MDVNDYAFSLKASGVSRFIASRLAPTGNAVNQRFCKVLSNTFTLVIDS